MNDLEKIIAEKPFLSLTELHELVGSVSKEELFKRYEEVDCHNILLSTKYFEFVATFPDVLSDIDYVYRVLNGKDVFPKIIEIHPGLSCNNRCVQCFSDVYRYVNDVRKGFPKYKDFLKQCIYKTEEVWFSGGKEPTSYSGFYDLLNYANSHFKTRLYTNGRLLRGNEEVLLGASQIRVSVNASSPKTYYQITGNHSFVAVTEALEALCLKRKEKITKNKIVASMVVIPQNYWEIHDFVCLMESIGIEEVQLRRDTFGHMREFTKKEVDTILQQIELSKHSPIVVQERGLSENDLMKIGSCSLDGMPSPKACMAGNFKRGIDPFGLVKQCEYVCHPFHDRNMWSLGNVRENTALEVFKRGREIVTPCDKCQPNEFGLNLQLEKIQRDMNYGFPIEKQPFRRKNA